MLEAILSYTAIASSVLAWTGDPVSKQQSSERAHDSFSHCYPKNHNIWKENSLVDTLPLPCDIHLKQLPGSFSIHAQLLPPPPQPLLN